MTTPKRDQWEVWLIHKRAVRLGVVQATDQLDAIRAGIKEFGITDLEQQKHVSARLVK